MIYLIDGHNLIGKMPGIKLSDPDDEEKLVRRLSCWTNVDPRRRIKLFFDSGEFGGFGDLLSTPLIRVQFSRVGKTADSDIIKFMEGVKNPREFTLVTSDREIIYSARKKKIGYILSEEFVLLLEEDLANEPQKEQPVQEEPGAETEVDVSDSEVSEWLNAFENAPHKEPDIHIVHLPPRPKQNLNRSNDLDEAKAKEASKKRVDPKKLKEGESALSKEDLDEWMAVFGDETIRKAKEAEKPIVLPDPAAKRKKKPIRRKGEPVTRKFSEGGLSEEEVDTWLDLFQTKKKED